jgi:hypothetical protein
MTVFIILVAGLGLVAIVASIRALRTDGYRRVPTAEILRRRTDL